MILCQSVYISHGFSLSDSINTLALVVRTKRPPKNHAHEIITFSTSATTQHVKLYLLYKVLYINRKTLVFACI